MATDYPGAVDDVPSTHTDAWDAVAAIQAELGANPSGAFATVVLRLASLLPAKNAQVDLVDSTNDQFARVDIDDDSSSTSGWKDRLAFFFEGVRTGYHNEYGELRARAAKVSTVAFRAMAHASAPTSQSVFQVANSAADAVYLDVKGNAITATVPINGIDWGGLLNEGDPFPGGSDGQVFLVIPA